MSVSMSFIRVPAFVTLLRKLNHMLDTAQSFVDAKKCDPSTLTPFRHNGVDLGKGDYLAGAQA